MSDSFADFQRKNRAQFERAVAQQHAIARLFISYLASELIVTTPGPNLQYPPDTEYIATGRLRAGWGYDTEARPVAGRWEGGPYTEHGEDTLAAIEAEVAGPIAPISFLQNEVAYGYVVHEGLGRHSLARPWVQIAALKATLFAEHARLEVMSGA